MALSTATTRQIEGAFADFLVTKLEENKPAVEKMIVDAEGSIVYRGYAVDARPSQRDPSSLSIAVHEARVGWTDGTIFDFLVTDDPALAADAVRAFLEPRMR